MKFFLLELNKSRERKERRKKNAMIGEDFINYLKERDLKGKGLIYNSSFRPNFRKTNE